MLAVVVVGCGDSPPATFPTARVPEQTAPLAVDIAALSARSQAALPGAAVWESPRVIVRDGPKRLAGVEVTFTVASGEGSVAASRAVTDDEGIATCGQWVLGSAEGSNSVIASIDSPFIAKPVVFEAVGLRPGPFFTRDPERFDLLSIGGQLLPKYSIARGHLIFSANGAFTYSIVGADSTTLHGRWSYGIDPFSGTSTAVFDLGFGVQGTATLVGDKLNVTYSDFDWESETYVRVAEP